MTSLPKVLYKYCDRWGADILEHYRLKVTPFNKFNDPFELAPRMRPDFSVEDASIALSAVDLQRDLYAESVRRRQFTGSFEEFTALMRVVKGDLAAKISEDYPQDAAEFRRDHIDIISTEFGLICLSAVPDDILMWSHYTNGHAGFVIGFDTSSELFADPVVHEVDYQEERVLMGHAGNMRDAPKRAEIIRSLIRRKSPHWRYEQEWRQLHFLAKCVPRPNPRQPAEVIYYKPIPSAAVCEVITGARCDSDQVGQLLRRPELAHVTRRCARLHDSEFKLVFENP